MPTAAPTTQDSCRNVSDRANALERRGLASTSRWITASSAILPSELALPVTNMQITAEVSPNSSAVTRQAAAATAAHSTTEPFRVAEVNPAPTMLPTALPMPEARADRGQLAGGVDAVRFALDPERQEQREEAGGPAQHAPAGQCHHDRGAVAAARPAAQRRLNRGVLTCWAGRGGSSGCRAAGMAESTWAGSRRHSTPVITNGSPDTQQAEPVRAAQLDDKPVQTTAGEHGGQAE